MGPDAVRSLLGDPNETFESIGVWHYYAVDGTALMLRFFGQRGQRNELGEARYERSDYGVSGRPVASVAADLNGRDIFKLLADRASEKSSPESYGRQPAALSPRPGEPR